MATPGVQVFAASVMAHCETDAERYFHFIFFFFFSIKAKILFGYLSVSENGC